MVNDVGVDQRAIRPAIEDVARDRLRVAPIEVANDLPAKRLMQRECERVALTGEETANSGRWYSPTPKTSSPMWSASSISSRGRAGVPAVLTVRPVPRSGVISAKVEMPRSMLSLSNAFVVEGQAPATAGSGRAGTRGTSRAAPSASSAAPAEKAKAAV